MMIGGSVKGGRLFLLLAKLFSKVCYRPHDLEDSKELVVKGARFNMHWWLRGALSGNRSAIVLTIAVSFWALGLHEGISDLIGAAHYRIAHESLKPLSSVRIAEVHDDMRSIDVLLKHIFVGLNSMRLGLDRFKNVDNPLKHFTPHFLFYHLI